MERICSFAEYVLIQEGSRLTSSKTGLYPLGYGGIGLYPDADYLTHAADAILYLTQDKRLYNNQDEAPFDITHLPGHELFGDKVNSGDGDPFNIEDLPGKPVPPKDSPMPGKIVPFKNWIKLVQKPKTISPPTPPGLPK
jgi:hypothetical protein